MAALATADDFIARTGRDLSDAELARVEAILDDVSAVVRAYTGQEFALAGVSYAPVKVRNGRARLPQRPVVNVSDVTDPEGNAVTWEHDLTADCILLDTSPLNAFELYIPPYGRWSALKYVLVSYTYGYDPVPAEIVAVVCQIAGRAFGSPATEAGITQESLGAYSYSQGGAAASGAFGLLAGERAILDLFRRPIGNIRVA